MYGVSTEYVRIPYGSSTGYTDIVEKIKEYLPKDFDKWHFIFLRGWYLYVKFISKVYQLTTTDVYTVQVEILHHP